MRWSRRLPSAFFRFHLTVDTLSFSYMILAIWVYPVLSPFRLYSCRTYEKMRNV